MFNKKSTTDRAADSVPITESTIFSARAQKQVFNTNAVNENRHIIHSKGDHRLDDKGESIVPLNIKFIYLDMSLDPNWIGSYYEGIGSIMTVLKRAGHNTSLLQVIKLLDDKDVLDFVDNDTDLVAFSTTTNMFPLVQKWSSLLKKHYPNIPLLCGGNHPTLAPKETLQQSVLDWACVGE